MRGIRFIPWIAVAVCLLSAVLLMGQSVNVTTWQNDIGRTGQNLNETTLTPSNVAKNSFGRICHHTLATNEQVYAQPLVVTGVSIGGTQKTVVYVVTLEDNVYALDGTTCSPLLSSPVSLLPTGETPADCTLLGGGTTCPTFKPWVGMVGTPVIDTGSGILYAVTESECPPNTKMW